VLLERIRYRAGPAAIFGAAKIETLASEDGPLRTRVFSLQRLSGSGSIELVPEDRLCALTTLEGSLTIDDGREPLELPRGRTAALPASLGPLRIELTEAHAMLCSLA
jgi:mannose-6-phosphate isomerase class I